MPRKAAKERIERYINKWKPRLLLNSWAVIPKYEEKDKVDKDAAQTLATMEVHPRYGEGWMEIFPAGLNQSSGVQQSTVVHELLHIPTNPIREALLLAASRGVISEKRADDLIEGLVEYVQKVMYTAYRRKNKKNGYLL